MHVAAAKALGIDFLAGGGLHQRRTAEEDRPLPLDDDGLIAHGRNVGAAGGAGPHHHRDLRDAPRRHIGLVVENATEMVAIGKHLRLQGQEGAAGVHQIDAGQGVLQRDLLGAQVFLHRDGVVGSALDGGVVGHHDAFVPGDATDAGDDAAGRNVVAIEFVRRELAQLQKRRALVQ